MIMKIALPAINFAAKPVSAMMTNTQTVSVKALTPHPLSVGYHQQIIVINCGQEFSECCSEPVLLKAHMSPCSLLHLQRMERGFGPIPRPVTPLGMLAARKHTPNSVSSNHIVAHVVLLCMGRAHIRTFDLIMWMIRARACDV